MSTLTPDDYRLLEQQQAAETATSMFIPIDIEIMLIWVASVVLYFVSKLFIDSWRKLGKTGIFLTTTSFIVSFFKISLVLSLLGWGIADAMNPISQEDDIHVATQEEYSLVQQALVNYTSYLGSKFETTITNNTNQHWEESTIQVTLVDESTGTTCGSTQGKVTWIVPGASKKIVMDPIQGCQATTYSIDKVTYNINSLTQKDDSKYVPGPYEEPDTFTDLHIVEEPALAR